MSQQSFILLGHSNPLGGYPAPVVPVGQLNGVLVAVYASDGAQELVRISESSSFVSHSAELKKSLSEFDYRLHRLFALDEKRILHYPIDTEAEFFLRLLQDFSFSSSNPFQRLSLAKESRNTDAIESELRNCIYLIANDMPSFLGTWVQNERQTLQELDAENLTSIIEQMEKLAAGYGISGTKSAIVSNEELGAEAHRTNAAQTEKQRLRLPVNDDIWGLVGNTPMIRLNRVMGNIPFRLYAKLEMLNPTGSAKDRPAIRIIKHGIDVGMIRRDTTIVETSSGNMAISLAQVCSYFGLRFICVIDPLTTTQNIRLLKAYGAEVEIVSEPDPSTGEFHSARIRRVKDLLGTIKDCFWPNEYKNFHNARAHHETIDEIVTALNGELDFLLCAVNSGNTLRGYAEYIRTQHLNTRIVAVEVLGNGAEGLWGLGRAKRLIPGHGQALGSRIYQEDLVDQVVHITDLDCIVGCHHLLRNESLLVGGSSGGVLMAVKRIRPSIPENASCVMIFHDRGDRYLDSIYSDAWLREHFGDVAYLWGEDLAEAPSTEQGQSL